MLDYTLANGTSAEQTEATKILYAEFGAEIGGQASLFVGSNLPLTLVGAGIGHVTAHHTASAAPELPPEALDSELAARQGTESGPTILKR